MKNWYKTFKNYFFIPEEIAEASYFKDCFNINLVLFPLTKTRKKYFIKNK
jgi:hypothetical protein